jgi:hypothetical protein
VAQTGTSTCSTAPPSCISTRNLLEDCLAFKCGCTRGPGELRDVVPAEYPESLSAACCTRRRRLTAA